MITHFLAVASDDSLLSYVVLIGGIALMFAVGVPWISKMEFGFGVGGTIVIVYLLALCLLVDKIQPDGVFVRQCIAGSIVGSILILSAHLSQKKK
jgi:hypothetical protein